MSRVNRNFCAGEFYHAFTSSIRELPLFYAPADCTVLSDLIDEKAVKYDLTVIHHCLMPDHFHILVFINSEQSSLSDFFKEVKTTYAKYLNRKFHRFGALFAGRFTALKLNTAEDIFFVCRYIHANPVISGFIDDLTNWRFSNWQDFLRRDFWKKKKDVPVNCRLQPGENYVDETNIYGLYLRKLRRNNHPLKYKNKHCPDFMIKKSA